MENGGKTGKQWYNISAQIIVGAAILILSGIILHLSKAVRTVEHNQRASASNNTRISSIEQKYDSIASKIEVIDRNTGWLKKQQDAINETKRLLGVINSTCKANTSSLEQSIRYIDGNIKKVEDKIHSLNDLHLCKVK